MFAPSTKVIVIDDMKTMRKMIRTALDLLGLKTVVEAEDASIAWPMLEAAANSDGPFQLIISDWNMPQMQGIELLRKVRAHDKLKAVPFLLVTAEAEQRNILEAVQAGVSNYIVKPFSQELFQEKLEAVFKKHST